jgi:hypothetical protein
MHNVEVLIALPELSNLRLGFRFDPHDNLDTSTEESDHFDGITSFKYEGGL